MTTSASLDVERVDLDPGGVALIPLQIRNEGHIVEGYDLEVVGPLAGYARVEPATVSVYPGSETTATVEFRVPRSAGLPAGAMPFAVHVVPTEHPEEAVVPEGIVQVLPFLDTTAELVPRISRGPRSGRHQVAIDNRGNVPVTAVLTAVAMSDSLRTALPEEPVVIEAGQAVFSPVRVRATRVLWRGMPRTEQFQVLVSPEDSPAVTLDGSYVQEPLLPPWLGKALLALLGLVLAVAALVLFTTAEARSAAEEAAQAAVAPQVARAAEQADAAGDAAQEAQSSAEEAAEAEEGAKDAGGGGSPSLDDGRVAVPVDSIVLQRDAELAPFARRLQDQTALAASSSTEHVVPEGETLQLTDLVLQNPQGDFGRVSILLDDEMLFSLALENFRDLDYHFVSPIIASAGQRVVMDVECDQVGTPPGRTGDPPAACDTAAYLGGQVVTPP